ncbi:lytic transglycosylase domain-containing protein [Acidiphilium sp. AL]|nr:lytic transglycosylase domain-containing protein [Acidiphilium sp. AL]
MIFGTALLYATLFSSHSADAQNVEPSTAAQHVIDTRSVGNDVLEASRRFRIPVAWIRAVIRVESGGHANAVSPKGALGLMQLMPTTYAAMQARYGLGADPLQPHDNIIAGAAYLREMLDCYGEAGFLAAYNAGPAQYDAYLTTGMPLPAETRSYVARLLPVIEGKRNTMLATGVMPPRDTDTANWVQAPLFVEAPAAHSAGTSGSSGIANSAASHAQPTEPSERNAIADLTPSHRALTSMFVPVSGKVGS